MCRSILVSSTLVLASLFPYSGRAADPAGPNGSIQYKVNSTTFGGDAGLSFTTSPSTVTLGGAGSDGTLKLVNEGGTDFTTTVISGATSNYSLTLPVDDGNSNQLLKTNGSGVLSWADAVLNPMQADLNANSRDLNGVDRVDSFILSASGSITLFELTKTHYIQLFAPTGLAADQTWHFPTVTGSSTSFLSSDLAQTATNKTLGAGTKLGATLNAARIRRSSQRSPRISSWLMGNRGILWRSAPLPWLRTPGSSGCGLRGVAVGSVTFASHPRVRPSI